MTEHELQIESKSIKVEENKQGEYIIPIPKNWIDTGDDNAITITTAKASEVKFVVLHDANTLDEEEAVLQTINAWIETAKDRHSQKRRYESIRSRFEQKWSNW